MKIHWITEKDIIYRSDVFSSSLKAFGVSFRLSSMDRSNNSRSIINSRRFARFEGYSLLLRSYLLPRGLRYLTDNPSPIRETKAILELSLMHVECLRRANAEKLDWVLVLEDDALFDFSKVLNLMKNVEFLENSAPAWYNLSSGAHLKRTKSDPRPDNFGFFRVRPYGTRCSSGYLVNRQFIIESLKLIDNYGLPDWTAVDIVYQILQRSMRAKCFWQEPPLISQGSETGDYLSNFKH